MTIRSPNNYDQDSVLWAKARLYFQTLVSRLKPGVSYNPNLLTWRLLSGLLS